MRISDWSSDVCSSDLAGATLFRSDGTTQQARTADALVAQVLGSPIPVEGLRDWLRGRTGSQRVDDLKKNAAGQIESFIQNGWSVRLRSEEHTSELQSLMRISYADFYLKKRKQQRKRCTAREHRYTYQTQNYKH